MFACSDPQFCLTLKRLGEKNRCGIYYLDFMEGGAAVFSKGPKDSSQYLMFDHDALVDVVNIERETLNLCEQKL